MRGPIIGRALGGTVCHAIVVMSVSACGSDECESTSTMLETVVKREELRLTHPIGPHLPPGTMLTFQDDDSVVVMARASDCFLEPLDIESTQSPMAYSASNECSTGVTADISHELLPVSAKVTTGESTTATLSFSALHTELVSDLGLRRAINDPLFPTDCLRLVAAGVQVVHRSGALRDFSAKTVDSSGTKVKLDAKIPDAGVDVGVEVSDSVTSTNTLRAFEPVTVGVATFPGTDLIDTPMSLPEVAVTNGTAWIQCHEDCSAFECRAACGDEWFTCNGNCSLDETCRTACSTALEVCQNECDGTSSACKAGCDEQFL